MLSLLIQSVYNIVDSFFVARHSEEGLTALSIIYPVQLLMIALATGTGVGINILVARLDGAGDVNSQNDIIKSGLLLGFFNFLFFAVIGLLCIGSYFRVSSDQPLVQEYGMQYAVYILAFSLGMFMEINCTKILQAKGNMLLPMYAQIAGATINIVLNPLLIFGGLGIQPMGIKGSAIATVTGQWCAMLIVAAGIFRHCSLNGKLRIRSCILIYKTGLATIIMQSLYTLYIVGLNLILKQFTENAVTVLGIYYKVQAFFFIPIMGLQQVILPAISFNYGAKEYSRISQTIKWSIGMSFIIALMGVVVFMTVPELLLGVFSREEAILEIGSHAFRVISLGFIPAAFSMILSVYFQGVDEGRLSIFLTVLRQVILLVPLAWLFHFRGLSFVWLTFPVTEIITALFCLGIYLKRNNIGRNMAGS
ncbi:MATE family efflux transporter [Desulfitobacterium hafniense]|nr:MATE family efflux transporter [Desulfitobacterium hafniense]